MIKNPETLNADFTLRYTYDIYFTNHLFSKDNPLIKDYFEKSKKKNHTPKILFLIDQGVIDHHPHLKDHILNYFQTVSGVSLVKEIYILPGGEIVKNDPEHLDTMLKAIDQHGIDRHSFVAAIGGGALLDAAGYAAAISHRGVQHIRIPTTDRKSTRLNSSHVAISY